VEWVSVTFLHAEFALKPVSLGAVPRNNVKTCVYAPGSWLIHDSQSEMSEAVPRNNVKTNFFHLVGTAGDSCSLATMSTAAVSDGVSLPRNFFPSSVTFSCGKKLEQRDC